MHEVEIRKLENSVGVALRTTQVFKDKWKKSPKNRQKEFSGFKNEKKDGKGPAPQTHQKRHKKLLTCLARCRTSLDYQVLKQVGSLVETFIFCVYL